MLLVKKMTTMKKNSDLDERLGMPPSAQYKELLDIIAEIIASDFLKNTERNQGGQYE